MMNCPPETEQTSKFGGQFIINATQRNPFGVFTDAQALEGLGPRVIQEEEGTAMQQSAFYWLQQLIFLNNSPNSWIAS